MDVIAKDAATIVLMRDREDGSGEPEVLLMRRHNKANFGAGAYVFPGGMLEPQDYGAQALALARGMTIAQANAEMPDVEPPEMALGLRIAAVRETFEEAGVLLAQREDGTEFHPSPAETEILRAAQDGTGFLELVASLDCRLPVDELVYFGHWITPESRPIRFDTRFFIAPVTGRVEARPDRQEVFDDKWVTPAEAVALAQQGEMRLMNPTVVNLRWLAEYSSTEQAVRALRQQDVQTIRPKIARLPNGKERIVQPWDEDYAQH